MLKIWYNGRSAPNSGSALEMRLPLFFSALGNFHSHRTGKFQDLLWERFRGVSGVLLEFHPEIPNHTEPSWGCLQAYLTECIACSFVDTHWVLEPSVGPRSLLCPRLRGLCWWKRGMQWTFDKGKAQTEDHLKCTSEMCTGYFHILPCSDVHKSASFSLCRMEPLLKGRWRKELVGSKVRWQWSENSSMDKSCLSCRAEWRYFYTTVDRAAGSSLLICCDHVTHATAPE